MFLRILASKIYVIPEFLQIEFRKTRCITRIFNLQYSLDKKKVQLSIKMSKFDIFLSYQWAIQEKVKELHHQLTKLGFRVWMDVYQMAGGNLHSEIVNGIKNSEIFVCCVTTKYSESKNCENELCFAYDSNKKIIAIMFEKVTLGDLMGVGLILARLLRINAFDDENFPLNNQSERFLELITALNPDELTSANTSSKILKNNILSNFIFTFQKIKIIFR